MHDVDWAKVKDVFAEVLESPRDQWTRMVESRCDRSAERDAVHELLEAHDRASEFLVETGGGKAPGPAVPEDDPDTIGPYTLHEKLGEGGFGVVYRAQQRYPVERDVAIKLLKRGMDTAGVITRFQAERQMLARMQHDDIARVLDAGATPDGRPFVVMELVQGESIVSYCHSRDLSVRDRVALMVRACRALHHAHQRAVIHRDVKPSNLLVTEVDGVPHPRVIDFGIAKVVSESRAEHTQAGDVLGTPRYMSPEQVRSDNVDIRTDVYSLGVVLCEVLTGQVPRDPATMATSPLVESPAERPSRLALRTTSTGQDPTFPRALRGDLDRIVLKCVAWDPDLRYDSAAALAEDLERYLRGEPVLAAPPSATYRIRKFVGRHRVVTALAAAAVLSLVAGTTVAIIGMQRAIRQQEITSRQMARAEFVADFFLRDMIDAADPDIARGEEVKVRALLGVAHERAIEQFADDPEILIDVLTRIGHALSKLTDIDASLDALRAAYEHSEAYYGVDDPITIGLAVDIETVGMFGGGGHQEAIERRLELRDRAIAALGPTHPETLRARQYAGVGLAGAAYLDEMLDVERAMRRQGMTNDPTYIRLLRSIAVAYADIDDKERELEYKLKAFELAEAHYGEGHSTWIELQKSIATAYVDLDRLDEAAALLQVVRDWEFKVFGPVHIKHLATLRILMVLEYARERFDRAHEHALESAEIAKALYGEDSIPHSTSMQLVGRSLLDSGHPDEARPILEHVLALRRTQWGATHEYVGVSLSDLAQANLELSAHGAAIEQAREAMQILGEDDRRWLITRIILAVALAREGDVDTGVRLLVDTRDRALAAGDQAIADRAQAALGDLQGP